MRRAGVNKLLIDWLAAPDLDALLQERIARLLQVCHHLSQTTQMVLRRLHVGCLNAMILHDKIVSYAYMDRKGQTHWQLRAASSSNGIARSSVLNHRCPGR